MILLTPLIIILLLYLKWQKKKKKYSHKYFFDYLSNENSSTIAQEPTDIVEVTNIYPL